eukprot:445566_1
MQSEDRVLVWGLNKRLEELEGSNGNIVSAIRQYYKFNERNYSTPLKITIDDIYYDLNIPIEIINLITIYNAGGIVYNYSKRFQQHTQNTIYILPIIFGYLQTFLFFLFICVMPHTSGNILLVIALLFAILLIIHGTCALLSYHKCNDYEIIVRNFKRALYNNENFIQHLKSITNAHIEMDQNIDKNDNNNALKAPLLPTEQRTKLMKYGTDSVAHNNMAIDIDELNFDTNLHWSSIRESYKIILNPSNNSFAYIAYQRWSNVKYLALKNDSFTRSRAALTLAFGKYWIPSYFILSIIISVSTPMIVATIWLVIYSHSFFVLYYCFLRVFQDVSHRHALLRTIKKLVFWYILCGIYSIMYVYVFPAIDKSDGDADRKSKASIGVFDIICLIIFGLIALPSIYIQMNILYNIIKYNRDTAHHMSYNFWLNSMFGSLWIGFFFLVPLWGTLVISIVFFVVMVISFYMEMQQLIHKI